MIRVLLAEDQALVRGALASLLGLEADLQVVAQVGRGDEVLDAVRASAPDVAVLDIEMPGASGLDVAEQLRATGANVRVVIVTTFAKPAFVRRAMAGGASAFLLKDAPAVELAAAIRRVVAGERVVDPGLAAAALSAPENPLTAREVEVLRRARAGGTTAQIAADLHLSHGTARNHLSAAMRKLGVPTRADALAVAEEQGWL